MTKLQTDYIRKLIKSNMKVAVKEIDGLFGKGYASEHPELVGDYMKSITDIMLGASIDSGFGVISESIEHLGDNIFNGLTEMK